MRIQTINIHILIVILFTHETAGKMLCMKIHSATCSWNKSCTMNKNILEQGLGLLSKIKQQLDNILSKVIPVPKQDNCKCGKAYIGRTLRIVGGRDAKVR